MASLEVVNLVEAEEKCRELVKFHSSIRVSLVYLFEWRTATNEKVNTQEVMPVLTLDAEQIKSSQWNSIWLECKLQIKAIRERNAIESGIHFEAIRCIKLNWLKFQKQCNKSADNAAGVKYNIRNIKQRNPNSRRSGSSGSADIQISEYMSNDCIRFVVLLYYSYRIHTGQSLPRYGRSGRQFKTFRDRFDLEDIEHVVANLENVHNLCADLYDISCLVYNRRGNIVVELERGNPAFQVILYWNEQRMLLITNLARFLGKRGNCEEYCSKCKKMHKTSVGCESPDIKLGKYQYPINKDNQYVLLTLYCDLKAICPPADRHIACCYSLIVSTGMKINIIEQLINEHKEIEVADEYLFEHLFNRVEEEIGKYFGWRDNGRKEVVRFTQCVWCLNEEWCLQLRKVIGELEEQTVTTPEYEFVCKRCRYVHIVWYEPVMFFHNLNKYSTCFVVRYLAKRYHLNIVGRSTELLYNISCGKKGKFLRFKIRDSLHFVTGSIKHFGKQVPAHKWRQYEKELSFYFQLFNSAKGEFAYERLQRREQLFAPFLKYATQQDNLLTGKVVSLDALKTHCEQMGLRTVGEYVQKYCTVDVVTQMLYFDNYRNTFYKEFGVDIAQFYNIFSVSWYLAMRKVHNCSIPGSINDYLCIKDNIREGVSQVALCVTELGKDDVGCIKMLNLNSLNSWCMTQELPTIYIDTLEICEEEASHPKWYFALLEKPKNETWLCLVDLEYPEDLHDVNAHFYYPLTPHPFRNRLCTTFLTKEKYLVLDKLLCLYVEKGLVIKRWYSIQMWKNTHIFTDFIHKNINAKNAAQDLTIKDARELANNALYTKTYENVFHYKHLKVGTYEQEPEANGKINARAEKWEHFTILDESYIFGSVKKNLVTLNKPIQLGFSILEYAKLRLYEFWFALCDVFGNDVKLLYTDTDTLLLTFSRKITDPFASMRNNPLLAPFVDLPIKEEGVPMPPTKELGRFSDELPGKTIVGYIGLNSKSYVLKFSDDSVKKCTIGIRASVTLDSDPLIFEEFKTTLFYH